LSFTDVGEQLPFFLRSWEHEHRLEALPAGRTRITDRLSFTTPWWLPHWLAQPAFKGLMAYRQPIYRRVFGG
jgi:ligand-binding SRPBCC domain-containing protein